MPKPIRGAENAEIECRIGAKSGAASAEITCRFQPKSGAGLLRFLQAHDVVGDAARAAVRAVEVKVRVVELVRMRGVAG
jgi:hypothetical protein